jgi:hypothetical protein
MKVMLIRSWTTFSIGGFLRHFTLDTQRRFQPNTPAFHVLKPSKPSEAVKELCRQIRAMCQLRLPDRGARGFCNKGQRRD